MIQEAVANKNSTSITGFTNDQQIAYEGLIKFINDNYDPKDYKRALVGAAGTGKTFLLNAVINNCRMSYSKIGISAPTHKACRVIQESINIRGLNINTLQSDLGLRLNLDINNFDINNPPFDPKGRVKIEGYSLYIIDESSMINRKLLMFIEDVCKRNKCKIIYVGDESQLPPVGESISSAFRNVKSYKLNQVVRQGDDNPISNILEILRNDIRNKTYNFLEYIIKHPYEFNDDNTKGYQICNTTEFNKQVVNQFNNEEFTKNVDLVKLISYTNNNVNNWNKIIRNAIIKDADKSIITKNDLITSYVTIVDDFNECVIVNSEEYILKDVINYRHPTYDIDGFMIRFTSIHGGKDTNPLFVVDHTNIANLAKYCNIANSLITNAKSATKATRADRWKSYYKFKEACLLITSVGDRTGNILYKRDIDYGFALTAHKSQGSTYENVLVDVNDIVFDKYGMPYPSCEEVNRRLYVACSRAKNKLFLKYGM